MKWKIWIVNIFCIRIMLVNYIYSKIETGKENLLIELMNYNEYR